MHAAIQTYAVEGHLRKRLAAATFLLMFACMWIVAHGYYGIVHDAQLYTFQALARLKPELLANDIYLRFGSQDNYTLFSPLYAKAIELLGLEHAAALLTLTFQVAFVTAAWLLARDLLPSRFAWLGIALLVTVRGDYGTYNSFKYLEDFVTPRMPAEALVLAGLIAMNARRYAWMWICLCAAALLHPLMSAAGVAFVLCVQVALPHPKAASVAGVVAAGLLTVIALSPVGASLRFDPEWFALVQRKAYLLVTEWQPAEWGRIAIPLSTVGIGAFALSPSQARTFCRASLLVGAFGIALTLLGADLLRIVVVTQAQPWRFLWIDGVVAVLLLPVIVGQCWQLGDMGRAAALLLVAVWVLRGQVYPLEIAPLALAAAFAAVTKHEPTKEAQRWIVVGAWLILALSVVWTVAYMRLYAKGLPIETSTSLLVLQARTWGREGTLLALLVTGLWWVCRENAPRVALYASAASALIVLFLLLPVGAAERTRQYFPPELYEAYSTWRQLVPPGEEVFWAQGDPLPAWVLLERPNYMTMQQTGSNLFSRRAGMELERRADGLRPAFNMDRPLADPAPTLAAVCARSDVKFLATSYDLGSPALADAPPGVSKDYRALRLYRCDRPRSEPLH